jgi:hypothetical protein
LSTALLVVLGQKQVDQISCLLISPSGPLAQLPLELESLSLNPGVLHFIDTPDGLREKLRLLRELGYTLMMYRYPTVEPLLQVLSAIPTSATPTVDPYGMIELSRTLPSSHIYCDLFGGSAPLLCCREPSPVEVINDRGSFVA